MFRRDARAEIAHCDEGFGATLGGLFAAAGDFDALAGRAVLERILDQVFKRADEFVAVAANRQRLGRHVDLDIDAAVARQHLQAVGDMAQDGDEIDMSLRLQMRAQFDARQRQQIVDQPRHARRLRLHDVKKARAGVGVVFRRTLQRATRAACAVRGWRWRQSPRAFLPSCASVSGHAASRQRVRGRGHAPPGE